MYLRAGSLYSTVDGSQQGVFWLVGEKKIKNKICLPANVGGRKKIKGKFSEFYLFLGIFNKKKYILSVKIYVMSEEKIKKKAEWSVFFLVGPDFSSSEESSIVKYSECALNHNILVVLVCMQNDLIKPQVTTVLLCT